MKKVYLIGDCHTTQIARVHKKEDNIDLFAWGKGGMSAWQIPEYLKTPDELSSVVFNSYDEEIVNRIGDIPDNSNIFVWLGYIDNKNMLPRYNDVEKTVKRMFHAMNMKYPNARVRYIEPLPQFVDPIYVESENREKFSYEERKAANDAFVNELNRCAEMYNTKVIAHQPEFLDCMGQMAPKDGNAVKFLSKEHAAKDAQGNYIDSLQLRYYEKIHDLIMSRV